ncbi:MarR family winged helix-turn-helix transcriptional regulator [Streptomyces sp. VRA16 Mangrove soil]|uniref:MarR family winged helix-turn-helix transcriptional regulator n=1 Tax=Streptomyces sp. VRA16 Mangrove soil TaxID=2817434 RepID=UPI001A9F5A46|nr:MarR family transcriptional regulator [Streptomyces sp. VRA16 Mangrove soil]MBO1330399.1 MarR family transcriptional regulator [Streptomyces sp. VRA16 Mangrove soil]
MPQGLPRHTPEYVAELACHVSELLDVLYGRAQEAAAGPLPPSQFRALAVIEERQRVNQRTLGEALGSRPSSVSRLCDRLEAAGLVERLASSTSRREVELRLSRRGAVVLEDFRASRAREIAVVLETMVPAHLRTLAEGLEQFERAATGHIGLHAVPEDAEGPSGTVA